MIRRLLLLALTTSVSRVGVVSDCLAVTGEQVLFGDVATLFPQFSSVPPAGVLGYAPAPGARRVFSFSELHRAAERHGIELASGQGICVERVSKRLETNELQEAMRRSLGTADARLAILEFSRYPVPVGEITFPRSSLPVSAPGGDGPVLWRGYVRYASKRQFPIWAKVRVSVPATRFLATENLPQGSPIQPHQVRAVESEMYPGNRPVPDARQIIGRVPRRTIAAGSEVPAALDKPRLVARGDTVRVEVQIGGAHLALEGRAVTAGDEGQFIAVRNPQSGRVFTARVGGKGQVTAIQH